MKKKYNSAFRNPQSTLKGKLYGVGIGPGDPKLLTIKAKEILDSVDVIFVPKGNDDGISCARSIIEETIRGKKDFVELTFPMTKDKKQLKAYWHKAVGRIVQELKENKNAAFVTIGDPLIYSTYIYLLRTLHSDFSGITTETIPGITSFCAAASRIQLPLLEGDEKMAVLPVTKNLNGLADAFRKFDTVILMKIGSKLDRIINLLKKLKLINNAILLTHIGQKDERIIYNLSDLKDRRLGYLSVVIVKGRTR